MASCFQGPPLIFPGRFYSHRRFLYVSPTHSEARDVVLETARGQRAKFLRLARELPRISPRGEEEGIQDGEDALAAR